MIETPKLPIPSDLRADLWDVVSATVRAVTDGHRDILEFAEQAWWELSPAVRAEHGDDIAVWIEADEAETATLRLAMGWLATR